MSTGIGHWSPEAIKYRDLYMALGVALLQAKKKRSQTEVEILISRDHINAEGLNDSLKAKDRLNLYLLTWAKLGYTQGMPSEILKMLKLPEIKAIPLDKPKTRK